MRVSKLIGELEQLDKNKDIKFYCFIESGRGGSWIEVDDCFIDDEENNYLLRISGDVEEDGGDE